MNKKEVIISIKNVTKSYVIHHQKPTLIENLLNRGTKEKYIALNNINLKIYKGDQLGIVGPNGSGKTTLLKLISGIVTQQKGSVITNGRVVSLIDLEAGFHEDLTGEENIFLNGLIIGMSKIEIEKQKESIIKFADIGKFINAPLYTYSSGMKLRLGFAVAVHSKPDILLLDESFAVGDEAFRAKATKKMQEFRKSNVTLIMVSHWLEQLSKNCNTILWMNKGKIVKYGNKKIIKEYSKFLSK